MFQVTVPVFVTDPHPTAEIAPMLRALGVTRVALTLRREPDYAFSSPDVLEQLKRKLVEYEENGFETLVWVGETFGHDTAAGGRAKYTTIRCIDAAHTENNSVFCPLDARFRADFAAWIEKIARCGATMILLDDDYRLGYRGTGFGCCCDLHMARLKQALGEDISREALRVKIFHGGRNRYRDAWLDVQKASMEEFAIALREAADRVDPNLRLGWALSPNSFDHDGDVADLAKIFAGRNKPFLRTLGAPYWAAKKNRRFLGEIVEMERMETHWLKGRGFEMFAEGDNFPRPRFATPAAFVECFETILRADGQSNGILKYLWDPCSDFTAEGGYLRAMARNLPLYDEIERMFAGKTCVGVTPFTVPHQLRDAEIDAEERGVLEKWQRSLYEPALNFTTVTSLPVSYEAGNVQILFGENARHAPEAVLKNGCVLDITAARILAERGIDVGVRSFRDVPVVSGMVAETDLSPRKTTARLEGDVPLWLPERRAGARLLSVCRDREKRRYDGAFTYENARGMRFLVLPFDANLARNGRGWFNSYLRRHQTVAAMRFFGKPLAVYDEADCPMLYLLVKEDARGVSVGLWNLFEDRIDNARLHIPEGVTAVRFHHCSGKREGDSVILDSVIYPYEFAGLELLY